jgi:hypothetical protein
MIYITIECSVYNCLDEFKTWAPELHHGFTTQGQPWWLRHGLCHLLSNSTTCRGPRLPSACLFWFGGCWWLDAAALRGRCYLSIEEELEQRGCRTDVKKDWAGRPRPVLASVCSPMLLVQLLTCTLLHVGPWRHLLCDLDKGTWRACSYISCSGPWSFTASCFGPWVIWSLVHLVSWIVTGFMIFS